MSRALSSALGQAEWPSQARSFSHVSRWFFFLSSQVPFSAVGNKYSKKSLPLAKSTVSVPPAALASLCSACAEQTRSSPS